jgi:hypothetical protein
MLVSINNQIDKGLKMSELKGPHFISDGLGGHMLSNATAAYEVVDSRKLAHTGCAQCLTCRNLNTCQFVQRDDATRFCSYHMENAHEQ